MNDFTETQYFRQSIFIYLIALVAVAVLSIFGYGIYTQIIVGKTLGNHPMSNGGLIVATSLVTLLLGLILTLFLTMKLETRIDREGIAYRFYPFIQKWERIDWEKIAHCEVITYNPIKDYGGWGIRYGHRGKAYNVRGNKGLLISFQSGKKLLIGTGKEQQLRTFLENIRPGNIDPGTEPGHFSARFW